MNESKLRLSPAQKMHEITIFVIRRDEVGIGEIYISVRNNIPKFVVYRETILRTGEVKEIHKWMKAIGKKFVERQKSRKKYAKTRTYITY